MTHIDLHSALAAADAAPYHDLVTRQTGARVRHVVEQQLAGLADGSVAFLDFTHIGVLDRSCADEFVAKLMLPLTRADAPRDGYVVLRGVNDGHLDAIEQVLLAHGLALVVQCGDGAARLVGAVTEVERLLWERVMVTGGAAAEHLEADVGLPPDEASRLLESLARRRLLRRDHDRFCPLGRVA
ncbi:MAG: hypothetical protein K1X31_02430 [Gemmatimonadaceae bacterium]|nr:hypothetical protein [Gemmatimonadaceae bacterium]